ncbi:peptidylprolyl isomerase [Rhizomonospora bruguierae]|uniref:peptidylprolyl isomerase n=1 Tax=Rhizomonospora bruguierae TaxID=1581705 RepID=UPI0020C0EFD2|nr:peptidylprolyl isomerase [Micromonospora sp. NBRC 107566]
MTSTRERQRAAARARLERQMSERAAAARKRRQVQTGIGAGVAVLLVAAGAVWAVAKFAGGDDKPAATANGATCAWTEVPPEERSPQVVDAGLPPTTDLPNNGTQVMKVDTNLGALNVKINLAKAPCIAANFRNLASKNILNDSRCHRAFPGMLQCGDPSAKGTGWRETDGTGGPSYRFEDENLPTNDKPAYPRGVVAMANSGPGTNGSQFFFISQDTELNGPNYAVIGTVDEDGLKILDEVDKEGNDAAGGDGTGHPKKDVTIKSITMEPVQD